jgi:hypothetical protein
MDKYGVDFSDLGKVINNVVKERTMDINKEVDTLGDLQRLGLSTSTPLVFTDHEGYVGRIAYAQTGYFDPDLDTVVFEKDLAAGYKPQGLKKCLILSPYKER